MESIPCSYVKTGHQWRDQAFTKKQTGKLKREGTPKDDCSLFSKPTEWQKEKKKKEEVGWNRAAKRLIWIKGNLRHN